MILPSEKGDLNDTDKNFQNVPNSETLTAQSLNITAAQDVAEKPSEEELKTLRCIGDKIQTAAWLVAMFSGAERFAYYALQAPLRIQTSALTITAHTNPDFQKTTSKTPPKTLEGQEL